MKIKHSKYRNTGLIFELLVKQIAADTLNREQSPAVSILKEFYATRNSLAKEYKLYDLVIKSKGASQKRAEAIKLKKEEASLKQVVEKKPILFFMSQMLSPLPFLSPKI